MSDSRVLFIADLHLGHKSICDYRTQFSDTYEHDKFITSNILNTVKSKDTLWILGDVAFTEEAGDWIVSLSKFCKVRIVLGNHDTEGKARMRNVVKYLENGIKVFSLLKYKDAWLSHCAIHPDELRGCPMNIHGHNHDKIEVGDGRYFSVSCENINYTPISYQDILKIMEERG